MTNAEKKAELFPLSKKEFEKLYALLGITFDECLGESFYHDALVPLVERLTKTGIAEVSEGALCIFFKDEDALTDKPCLIRKADGGFLYATTDLATIDVKDGQMFVREMSPGLTKSDLISKTGAKLNF